MSIVYLNDSNFEDEIGKQEVPCIIDFFAQWCGPCNMLGPVFEKVSDEYEGKCEFFKVNVDDAPNTAAKFAVMSIPTIIILVDGEKKAVTMGALGEDALKEFIEKNI